MVTPQDQTSTNVSSRKPLISVFGSAGPKPGSSDYGQAQALGTSLGESGFDVLTGGYAGVMEAVSRGANEAGARVLGATCEAIINFRPGICANDWVTEEVKTETLLKRLGLVTSMCDAVIVLPGGVGTLVELALVWNSIMIGELPQVPIIAIGEPWSEVLAAMNNPAFLAPEYFAMVVWAPDTEAAMKHLRTLVPCTIMDVS